MDDAYIYHIVETDPNHKLMITIEGKHAGLRTFEITTTPDGLKIKTSESLTVRPVTDNCIFVDDNP